MKFRRRRRYNRSPIPAQLFIIVVPIALLLFAFSYFKSSPETAAEKTVSSFYQHEQNNDFASSWELFHPQMKTIFTKSDYIRYRNHIFVDQLGAKTFDYSVGEAKVLSNWKMTEQAESLSEVYEVPVTQKYKSTFGNFTHQQNIYVVKNEGEWRILWSYD
ncbi:hypothetical protein IMZ08_03925 [Bacillus luteolus]|uniref:DUF4829 domain-containing protein n=1 Tax=Litchfieldia luteola TaxID=682179 RepID=A0ABR9QFD1_9BACI|nr:hypothetical protein [Cytobacillus luteolus]MBE4907206.1 hypothetical protein [Cytobacillus luteolus]MBP1943319.1 hypothetical protein [Cytobacillus luteolus]